MQPDTHYAKCGELHIAYQIFGEGSVNLAIVPPVVMTFGKASTPLENIGVAPDRFPQTPNRDLSKVPYFQAKVASS